MIDPAPEGVFVHVRVTPRAGRHGVSGIRNGALLVKLNAAPVGGAANAELIEILSDTLDVPKTALTIVRGERSRQKLVLARGMTVERARALLEAF